MTPALPARPEHRPVRPYFSSGPCVKRPGWTLDVLKDAFLGRSHRAQEGLAKLKEVIVRSRQILGVPADYRIAIVPGSDTGAVEMALWTLLGEREVDCLAWEAFGANWVTDVGPVMKLANARLVVAPYGSLPDLSAVELEARRGVHLERHLGWRARARWRLDRRRPRRPVDLRRHFGRIRDGHALAQAGRDHLVLAEGDGR